VGGGLENISLQSRLGGVMVSMLSIGLNGRALKPDRGNGLLNAIKLRSTPSFGGEVKLLAPLSKLLRHVKEPFEVSTKIFRRVN
jgi:hypothetical protein